MTTAQTVTCAALLRRYRWEASLTQEALSLDQVIAAALAMARRLTVGTL